MNNHIGIRCKNIVRKMSGRFATLNTLKRRSVFMNAKAFIQRHPVITYFIMTFIISWGGALAINAPILLRGESLPRLNGILMYPMLILGPAITGIVLTLIVDGKAGVRDLFSRMGRWHVGIRWYAAAFLIPPALILIALFSLHALISPVFMPNLNPSGLMYGIVSALLEEIGWLGFAFPKMRAKHSPLSAALLLGILWGLWHLPVIDFLGAASPHGAYWLPFALAFIVAMTFLRILIVWIYSNTNSILLGQIMHASSTGFLVAFSPLAASPAQESLWYAVYAVELGLVVALVVALYGKYLVRQPAQVKVIEAAIESRII
jgi:uncharacterized protein